MVGGEGDGEEGNNPFFNWNSHVSKKKKNGNRTSLKTNERNNNNSIIFSYSETHTELWGAKKGYDVPKEKTTEINTFCHAGLSRHTQRLANIIIIGTSPETRRFIVAQWRKKKVNIFRVYQHAGFEQRSRPVVAGTPVSQSTLTSVPIRTLPHNTQPDCIDLPAESINRSNWNTGNTWSPFGQHDGRSDVTAVRSAVVFLRRHCCHE